MKEVSKADWIASVAHGRTFADVGGLRGAVNEMVSVACLAGASHGTMIDIQQPETERWRAFDDRMTTLGVANYSSLQADATRDGFAERVGVYDNVHCAGIFEHLPDPFQLILRLRQITREHLVFTSMYVPSIIKNEAGRVDLKDGQAVLIHALRAGKKRDVIVRHLASLGLDVAGLTRPLNEPLVTPDGAGNTSPWWWLMTPELVAAMLDIAGFEVIDQGDSWAGRSVSLFCRVKQN